MSSFDTVRIGLVSASDRAAAGVYTDQGIPALQSWLGSALHNPIHWETRLVPDEQERISAALRELIDAAGRVRYAHRSTAGPTFRSTDELIDAVAALRT